MRAVIGARGFALPELMVALVVLCGVGAAISEGLRRQQQVFRGIAVMVAVRSDVRDAAEVLAADISVASPLDTLAVARDSAIEFLGLIAASVSCDSAPGYVVRLPPEKLASEAALTAILATPDSGDVMLLYRRDTTYFAGEPEWDRHTIASVATQAAGSSCPPSSGFTTATDAAAPAYVLTLSSPVRSATPGGTPIRVLRRTRYSLYRSSDSRWYLGNRRCNSSGSSGCSAIQPVSGPYLGYSGGGASGIALSYFDDDHASLTFAAASSQAARVRFTIRARSIVATRVGRASSLYLDSAQVSIALRNRE